MQKKHILNNNFCSTDYKSFSLSSYYCIFELTTSLNQIKMKKKHVLLAAFAAAMLTPTVAWAQYPQITDEAKENYKKMMTESGSALMKHGRRHCQQCRKKQKRDVLIFLGLVVHVICHKRNTGISWSRRRRYVQFRWSWR